MNPQLGHGSWGSKGSTLFAEDVCREGGKQHLQSVGVDSEGDDSAPAMPTGDGSGEDACVFKFGEALSRSLDGDTEGLRDSRGGGVGVLAEPADEFLLGGGVQDVHRGLLVLAGAVQPRRMTRHGVHRAPVGCRALGCVPIMQGLALDFYRKPCDR